MNVSPIVNTNLNKNAYTTPRQNNAQQPAFTGVSQMYDSFGHGVGKHFCRHIFDNALVDKMAYIIRNSDNAVKHFLAVGSVITSGMYMKQTLTNKNMDKDRRQTLAVNQLFTLILSTVGAYTLDGKLKSWWGKQHEKFIKLSDNGKAAWEGMEAKNKEIKASNEAINEDITSKVKSGELKPDLQINDDKELAKLAKKFIKNDKDGTFAKKLAELNISVDDKKDVKGLINKVNKAISNNSGNVKDKIKQMVQAEDYVRKLVEPKLNIDQYLEKYGKNHVFADLDKLKIRSKGFGALRSILVFGFVYRFFVPLVVVKPTNWLCEKYLEYKKAKQAEKV